MEIRDSVRLGLRENWHQFGLLVVVNAFVGSMVGLERTVLPLLAEEAFGLVSSTAVLSFIATFGATKALANVLAGQLGDRFGRKRVLVAGWLFALPVPFLVIYAPAWGWVIFANVLLGINQGLAWSTTIIMKIDLVGPRQRGLAMGLNEAAGYVAVSLAALVSGYVAATYGLRPQPFYLGVGFALAGLLLSVVAVRETHAHARLESKQWDEDDGKAARDDGAPSFREVFYRTSWGDRALFSVSQAGMVNNLNDGLAWGLFPLYFASLGLPVDRIGVLAAVYPGVWGLAQLATGAVSDRTGRKGLIVAGMLVQAAAIFALLVGDAYGLLVGAMALLGLGTAMVYPTLLAAIGDVAHPSWRGSSVGVYRLWRDGGYVAGALLAGLAADLLGIRWSIGIVGAITSLSGLVVARMMYETAPRRTTSPPAAPPSRPVSRTHDQPIQTREPVK